MDHSAEMRRCLEAVDIAGIRKLWQHVSTHLPQPERDADALVAIHHARTQSQSIAFKLRAYSHRWLTDRGYPSGLPDELKPKAERIYPRIVEAVGISVNSKSQLFKPIMTLVRDAMSDAVEEAFADGRTEPAFVSARMQEARVKTVRQLVGRDPWLVP